MRDFVLVFNSLEGFDDDVAKALDTMRAIDAKTQSNSIKLQLYSAQLFIEKDSTKIAMLLDLTKQLTEDMTDPKLRSLGW